MKKIISVRQSGESLVVLKIRDEDKLLSYTVNKVTYASLGSPVPQYELSDEELSEIVREDEIHRALKRSLSILSYSDVSESALRVKLRRSGFSREAVDEGVRECVMRGYLDEDRQLRRFITREACEGFRGPYFIRKKLMSKGYSASRISSVMSDLTSSGEVDFREIFSQLCDREEVKGEDRLALAYKRGFKA